MLPFAFRSPLDLANGIRGDALFTDLYDHPEDVHRLVDRCAEAILAAHRRILAEAPVPQGRWGMWRTWLPDGILFMNADPVDLISTEFAESFDRPSSQHVMTAAGGGFYHHHTLGVHQIEYAAGLEGVTVHNLVADSNDLLYQIRDDAQIREAVLAASLVKPIHWKLFDGEPLRDIVDILRHGRFILDLSQADDPALCRDLAERIGKVSNLG